MCSNKALATFVVLGCCGVAAAQPSIYSNASANVGQPALATGTLSGSGASAPGGGQWSELQTSGGGANAVGGVACHASSGGGFRLADDFVVTGTLGWRVDNVTLYAYQTGAAAQPFSGVNIQVWNGRPGDAGSTVVFGDTTTNRMLSCSSSNVYRTFSTTMAPMPATPDSSKTVWAASVNLGQTRLAAGHYWLDWQFVPATVGGEAFSPAATVAGVRTQAGWNARQLGTGGAWADVLDYGKPSTAGDVALDLPFMISGFVGNPPCSADFDGDGDVGTDADIEAFFRCIAGDCCATCAPADFNGDGDSGTDADIEAFFRVLAGQPC